jgi:hypothetical protein
MKKAMLESRSWNQIIHFEPHFVAGRLASCLRIRLLFDG